MDLYDINVNNIVTVATMIVVIVAVTIYWVSLFSQLQIHQTTLSVDLY